MDPPASSESCVGKGKTGLSSTALRADAPIFQPSGAFAPITSTTASSVSAGDGGRGNHKKNSRVSNHRLDRGPQNRNEQNSRTKKPQRQQRRQKSTTEKSELDPKIQNKSRSNELEKVSARITHKNRRNKGDRSRRSKQKDDRKARRNNHRPMEQLECKNSDDNRRASEDIGCHSNTDTSKDDLELASSLAFPALMEQSESAFTFAHHKMQQELWNDLSGIREAREEESRVEEQQELLEDQESSWQDGLDRLTSNDQKTKDIRTLHRKPEFLSWDENDKAEEKEASQGKCHERKQYAAIEHKTSRSTKDLLTAKYGRMASEKRGFDMKKLRDKWWTAVADQQQRFQEQHAEELKQKEKKPSCCVDATHESSFGSFDENIQTNDSSGENEEFSTDSSTSSMIQDGSIHCLPALRQVPLYQSTTSRMKLLDLIIEQNDENALREVVELSWNAENKAIPNQFVLNDDNDTVTAEPMPSFEMVEEDRIEESGIDLVEHAIAVVIRQNRPNLLRTILSITDGRAPINSKPLLHAAGLGHEECASILLSKQEKGSTMLFLNDIDGNTALHYCCEEHGKKDILLMLLKQVVGNTKRKRQQLSKLVTARNKNLQTPVHVACQSGRNDLVEVFLTTCASSLLFKILSIEDMKHETPLLCAVSNNSCDAVLSLLMWRRNHDHQGQKQSRSYSDARCVHIDNNAEMHIKHDDKGQQMACPLVWAAKSGNLEMIDLLIQFGDQSGTLYQVTEALFALLQSDVLGDVKLRGSNSLILAGANPFQEIDNPGVIDGENYTSISMASKTVSDDIIRSMLSTALQLVNERQLARRRDPVLQQQPEAFFKTLESKENAETDKAMINTLIETLFRAYSNREPSDLSKAIALYEQIQRVHEEDLMQLQASLRNGTITSFEHRTKNWYFLATHRHSAGEIGNEGSKKKLWDSDRSVFAEKSFRLLKIPWVQDEVRQAECSCPWMSRNASKCHPPPDLSAEDALMLIANDGSKFSVHAPTVSEKSGKLASALRFAKMKKDEDSIDEVINLEVDIAPEFCKLMIQHMYHGSICFGWPSLDNNEMCRFLLELMLIAEEFLIPSLVQEIEMRLLSSNPTTCFCWNCCEALRVASSDDGKKEAQCLFLVNSNSRLINQNTALDVLSLSDYLGGLDYNIFLAPVIRDFYLAPKNLWATYDREVEKQKQWKVNKALASLRNIASITILKEFAHVVKSPDFHLTTEDDRSTESQKQNLLRLCLDELRNNSAIAVAYSNPIERTSSRNRTGRSYLTEQ